MNKAQAYNRKRYWKSVTERLEQRLHLLYDAIEKEGKRAITISELKELARDCQRRCNEGSKLLDDLVDVGADKKTVTEVYDLIGALDHTNMSLHKIAQRRLWHNLIPEWPLFEGLPEALTWYLDEAREVRALRESTKKEGKQ